MTRAPEVCRCARRNMNIIDCHDRKSSLTSVARIYNVSESAIKAFLTDTDLERHYKETNPQQSGDRELTLLLERTLGCTISPVDRVYWFHLSRAKYDADFSKGILTLNEALPNVWDTILDIFCGTKHELPLTRLRDKGVSDFHYCLKVGSPIHAGPYAMLVRESAFQSSEMGNHDYLYLPEIMEDICNEYHTLYGEFIHDTVAASLVPHIVTFWSDKYTGKDCVESAIYYLYCVIHGHELSMYANTCFNGENCRVPPEQIVKIEKGCELHNIHLQETLEDSRS